jgi:hypothetical protein
MYSQFAALTALALVFSGCVTASNTLPLEQVANLRVASVNVGFARDARIAWADGESAYAATKGLPAHESGKVAGTPDAQAYIRNIVGSKVKAAMERHLSEQLKGSQAVRAEVTVVEINVAPAIQRVLVGGGHSITADVKLVDAKTGALIVDYPAQKVMAAAGGGVGGVLLDQALLAGPIDRLADQYASQYGYWLVPGSRPGHPDYRG